ncbi:hypothetical protein NPIL_85831 [Nephila pilipes]|uniref:Uncharacterized protein n=1 Tax=Nephila pilipes TaxID=299642 RepID=A0A8X6QW03_NEPPI|nr:hypothetical protein NPIL_85831 [Nephila pilipes]
MSMTKSIIEEQHFFRTQDTRFIKNPLTRCQCSTICKPDISDERKIIYNKKLSLKNNFIVRLFLSYRWAKVAWLLPCDTRCSRQDLMEEFFILQKDFSKFRPIADTRTDSWSLITS